MTTSIRRSAALRCGAVACLLVLCALALAGCKDKPEPVGAATWSEDVLDTFGRLPVQHEGRVKPLSTWARFTLLKMNHRSTLKLKDERKVPSLVWALDALFHPKLARTYPIFRVENDEVVTDIGLRFEGKKKADRYSYDELEPGRDRLVQRFSMIRMRMDERNLQMKDLSRLEQGLFLLGVNVLEFEDMLHYFDFARSELRAGDSPALKALFDDREYVPLSRVIPELPVLGRAAAGEDVQGLAGSAKSIEGLVRALNTYVGSTRRPRMLPPISADNDNWSSPWQLVDEGLAGKPAPATHVAALKSMEQMVATQEDPAAFAKNLSAFHKQVTDVAEEHGQNEKISLEVRFYKLDPFFKSMLVYILAFLLIALTWFRPQMRGVGRAIWLVLAAGLLLQAAGIVMRCILRDRPPVSTLYETVIFIGAVGVLSCLLIEIWSKRGIALAVAPILGFFCLFMAQGYEELNRQDTMPQLVAVLDTNYWLTIHVLCISIGYTAGLLAGVLAHVFVLGKAFGLKAGSPAFYTDLGRMVYGTVCFALLFSVVGTILGGVWANDSWGRFWGWDPKENGALLICIWQLVSLHARIGGYVKQHGFAMMSVFGTAVVAFSWWHVNNLGIGLHSYGFTQGILDKLMIFYFFEGAVLLTGGIWWLLNRAPRAST
jgi:ABC-type transport system involved in cytochrome c biogenesis permease subunit